MRSNSLATSRAKTQSVGNSSTAPFSGPACRLSSCLPAPACGSASLALNSPCLSFLPHGRLLHLSCPTPTLSPHSTTSSTILLYFILRELEVRGDGSHSGTHMSRKICREARGMILWQTLKMTIPSSPQITKPSRMQLKSFTPTSLSSLPSTARFSSPQPHWVPLHS